ncbi:hypothetical protein C9374_001541 [Naegleria lovaniensis]|uniref:CENP-V/GFA domain-containing protein n=1 Tax=Naegleria lovaniensis TaxID=51637 RepID=A0AA88GW31_NAELO|nr:uncharacterized protein C9374_001541 [Naegleria lovaniensis]KAG2387209.1 hypothetical protein C9374_001541 [Naegleria lovaniensis]
MSTSNLTTTTSSTLVDPNTHKIVRTAHCRCGKLSFSVEGNNRVFGHYCHCRNCRKGTFAPFTLLIAVPFYQFKWTTSIKSEELRQKNSNSFESFTNCPQHEAENDIPQDCRDLPSIVKTVELSPGIIGFYCSECGAMIAQKPTNADFISTLACCYDEMQQAFCPLTDVIEKEQLNHACFFTPENHVNYENRVCDVKDDLPKFMDFPQPRGSGRMYEPVGK